MIKREVISVEEMQMPDSGQNAEFEEPETEGYVPRPARQVWLARLGVVIAILLVISQIVSIARGGM